MSNSSIWPIDRTLSGATFLGQGGPGSNNNEGVLLIPQNFSITGASPSDFLGSYLGYSLVRGYVSAEMLPVYHTVSCVKIFVAKSRLCSALDYTHEAPCGDQMLQTIAFEISPPAISSTKKVFLYIGRYIFTKSIRYGQDATQFNFLSRVKLV